MEDDFCVDWTHFLIFLLRCKVTSALGSDSLWAFRVLYLVVGTLLLRFPLHARDRSGISDGSALSIVDDVGNVTRDFKPINQYRHCWYFEYVKYILRFVTIQYRKRNGKYEDKYEAAGKSIRCNFEIEP
jgi:hypothetical protein